MCISTMCNCMINDILEDIIGEELEWTSILRENHWVDGNTLGKPGTIWLKLFLEWSHDTHPGPSLTVKKI